MLYRCFCFVVVVFNMDVKIWVVMVVKRMIPSQEIKEKEMEKELTVATNCLLAFSHTIDFAIRIQTDLFCRIFM